MELQYVKEGAPRAPGNDVLNHSRPLSAMIGEELSTSANRTAGEVVKAVDDILPDFESLKDCVLRLLKVWFKTSWSPLNMLTSDFEISTGERKI